MGVTFSVTSSCLTILLVWTFTRPIQLQTILNQLLNKFRKCGEVVGRREAGILKTANWLDLPTPLEGIVVIVPPEICIESPTALMPPSERRRHRRRRVCLPLEGNENLLGLSGMPARPSGPRLILHETRIWVTIF